MWPTIQADRPADFAAANGWDRDFEAYDDFDLPTYVGPSTFSKLPWVTDPGELRGRGVDVAIVGAPFDDAVSHRPGARFGPRAIREAQYTSGSIHSLQLLNEPFEILTVVDAGDANIVPGGDHPWPRLSSTARSARSPRPAPSRSSSVATTRSPGRRRRRSPRSAIPRRSASSTSTPTPTPRPRPTGSSRVTARRCDG